MAAEAGVEPFEMDKVVTAVKAAAERLDHIDLAVDLPESAFAKDEQFAQSTGFPDALKNATQGMGVWQHGVKGTQMFNAYVIQAAARDFPGLDHATADQVEALLNKAANGVPTVPGTGGAASTPPNSGPSDSRPGWADGAGEPV